MGLIGIRPNYEFYGEKSRAKDSVDPKVIAIIEYCAGVKEQEKWIYRIDWTKKIYSS